MELSAKFLNELQKRLKIGNRKGVHLNAIPGKSNYKFDISRLSYIEKNLPENFIKNLLEQQPLKFRISWKNNVPDLNTLIEEDQTQLVRITKSFENLINQTETIESEKGINTFGFGFPMLIRRNQVDNQLTVSPILIWSLRVRRTKEFNTWEIIRTEDDPIYINEVLINHLLNDAQVEIRQISEEMLDDGIIDKDELLEICVQLLENINTVHSPQLRSILAEKFLRIIPIKERTHYESLPITSNNAFIEFGGLFSIFEVQKQNIINDYDHLLNLEGSIIQEDDLEDNQFQPLSSIDTDPSQQSILNILGTKRNVVIQGPPGTGKSQSLTALLVNALENKKKVLVVCEKRTALEVLEAALVNKGLKHNCVLIKDIVKDRKIVVDSVRDRIDSNVNGYRSYNYQYSKETLDEITGKAAKLISSVNKKHKLLGRRLLANRDWTALVGEILREKRRNIEDHEIQEDNIKFDFNAIELNQYLDLIQKGQKLWQTYEPNKELSFINPSKLIGNNPFQLEQHINEDYGCYKSLFNELLDIEDVYLRYYQDQRRNELNQQIDEVKKLKILVERLNQLRSKIILFKESYSGVRSSEINDYTDRILKSISSITAHTQSYNAEKFYLNEKETATPFYRVSLLFSKKRRQTLQHQKELLHMFGDLELLSNTYKNLISYKSTGQIAVDLEGCNQLLDRATNLKKTSESFIDKEFDDIDFLCQVQKPYASTLTEEILEHARQIQSLIPVAETGQQLFSCAEKHVCDLLNQCKDLGISTTPKDAFSALYVINEHALIKEQPEKTYKEFKLIDHFNPDEQPFPCEYPIQLLGKFKEIHQKITSDNWAIPAYSLESYKEAIESLQLFLDAKEKYFNHSADIFPIEFNWFNYYNNLQDGFKPLIKNLKAKKEWRRAFLIYYLNKLLIQSAEADMPVNDLDHVDLSQALGEIRKEQYRYIKEYWYSKQIQLARQFELDHPNLTVENLYNKRSSHRFQRLSLRLIVQHDPDLFTTFFPIVLTTPDVCCNLFKGMNSYFDMVIFDEASQLRLEDNLPAILKGKQVIVAGDEHQMPPSNYFSKIFDGSIEDEEDIEDEVESVKIDKNDLLLSCESLLDFATELGFEKRYLDFHYRSRHPYLIDFSNHAFYNQRLRPLPNNFDYIPIRYVAVGGTFSEHTNEKEAEMVLSIIEHQIHKLPDGKYPTVGVATFNIAQRNLIKSKILERQKFEKYGEFNEKIAELENNGFFIKNLENIQGDERDIIIICTTYGVNKDGRFMQRFGPISMAKGYKLLNVIITRAKYKVFIVSSIPEDVFLNYKDQLIAEGSNNRRAVFFAYMTYCKAVSDQDNDARISVLRTLAENSNVSRKMDIFNDDLESPFEEEVYAALCDHFDVDHLIPQMQFAGYRIDIVYDSKISGKPKIAIECDGAKYHESQEAYLYDLYRQRVLEQHGFIFHRIWSTNWWRNSKRETENLVNFIQKITEQETSLIFEQRELSEAFADNLLEITNSIPDVIEDNSNIIKGLVISDKRPIQNSLFQETIQNGSTVNIKYLNTEKNINIKLVSKRDQLERRDDGIQCISIESPLGRSLIGAVKGDIVKIGDLDNYVEILAFKAI